MGSTWSNTDGSRPGCPTLFALQAIAVAFAVKLAVRLYKRWS